MKISKDYKEFVIVAGVMTGLLLPVRLLFVEYVSDSTWGSLGLISAISVIMVILVKKHKLGSFGRMFERQMLRLTTGKKRIFVATMLTLMIAYFSFSIYATDLGNTMYAEEKEVAMAEIQREIELDFNDIDSVTAQLEPEKVIGGIPAYADGLVNNFKVIAITQAILNDFSNGMILHFHIVFWVEGVELAGVYIFYAIMLRREKKQIAK